MLLAAALPAGWPWPSAAGPPCSSWSRSGAAPPSLIALPVRGWSAAQWIGVLARHLARSRCGWTAWQSAAAGRPRPTTPTEADLPGVLAGIQIHDGPPMPGRLDRPAIIQNHAARTWAATARITHPGIGMADDDDRDADGRRARRAPRGRRRRQPDPPPRPPGPHRPRRRHRTSRLGRASTASPTNPTLSAELHAQLDRTPAAPPPSAPKPSSPSSSDEDAIGRDAKRAGRGIIGRARVLYHLLAEVEARCSAPSAAPSVTWLDTAEPRRRHPHRLRTRRRPRPRRRAIAPTRTTATHRAPRSPARRGRARQRLHRPALLPPRRLGVRRRHHPAAPQGRRDGRAGPGPGALHRSANAAR